MLKNRWINITLGIAVAFGSHLLNTTMLGAQTIQVRGIDHVGINVPDMDVAIKFFSETFGFKPATEMRDIPVDDGFRKLFQMHSGAKVKSIVMLRAGNGANLELFQYDSPDSVKSQPYYDDAGAAHIGFYTDDINAAVTALRAKGITVLTDPIVMSQGPTAGESWAYFLTPWGAKLELVTYPKGKAYEKEAGAVHLWTPSASNSQVKVTATDVQPIADGYLPLFNEKNAAVRLAGLNRYFATDISFLDPEGIFVGTDEVNRLISTLQGRNSDWSFKQTGKVEVAGNTARIPWQYGPKTVPDKIRGEDIVTIRDGKVASLSVFLIAVK